MKDLMWGPHQYFHCDAFVVDVLPPLGFETPTNLANWLVGKSLGRQQERMGVNLLGVRNADSTGVTVETRRGGLRHGSFIGYSHGRREAAFRNIGCPGPNSTL